MKKSVLLLLILITTLLAAACSSEPKGQLNATDKKPQEVKARAQKPHKPKSTYETLEVTESVPFSEERTQDPNLEKGQSQTRQEGAAGMKTFTYKVQLKDGAEVTRTLENEVVSIEPAPKIIADGTKEPPPPPPPPPVTPVVEQTVYGTNTGARYHQDHGHVGGCHSYLRSSKIAMTISQAQARGLTPCQCGSCSW